MSRNSRHRVPQVDHMKGLTLPDVSPTRLAPPPPQPTSKTHSVFEQQLLLYDVLWSCLKEKFDEGEQEVTRAISGLESYKKVGMRGVIFPKLQSSRPDLVI